MIFAPADGVLPPGEYVFVARDLDGEVGQCTVRIVEDERLLPESDCDNPAMRIDVDYDVDGQPLEVTVVAPVSDDRAFVDVSYDGVEVLSEAADLEFDVFFPNGRVCGPRCESATVDFVLPSLATTES